MGHTVSCKGKPSSGFGMILTPNMRFVPLDVMNIALRYGKGQAVQCHIEIIST